MTITQLRIALTTAREGSISGAARQLGIPQPNASSSIKALEKELKFKLFRRVSGGMAPTDKGQLFLEHAQKILTESDRISELTELEHIFRLRVGCSNYYKGRNAFMTMCMEHRDEEASDLQYYNMSIENGIQLLYEHKLDVVIGLTVDRLVPTVTEIAKSKHVTCRELGEVLPVITLRRDHPIVQEGLFEDKVDVNVLKDYPYVAYHSLTSDFEAPYYKAVFEVPCKYSMYIEERETRFNLVRFTDAFSLGGKMPEDFNRKNEVVEYVYPGYILNTVVFYRSSDETRPEIQRFVELIQEQE